MSTHKPFCASIGCLWVPEVRGCNCTASPHPRRACTWESGCCERHRRDPRCDFKGGAERAAARGRRRKMRGAMAVSPHPGLRYPLIPGASHLAAAFNHTLQLPLFAMNPSVIDMDDESQRQTWYMVRITPKSLCTEDWRKTSSQLRENSYSVLWRRRSRTPLLTLPGVEDARAVVSAGELWIVAGSRQTVCGLHEVWPSSSCHSSGPHACLACMSGQ